jgi:hypothetical protein
VRARRSAWIAALLAVLTAATTPETPAQQVTGLVFDASTGQPMRARVLLIGPDLGVAAEVETDASGRFAFSGRALPGSRIMGVAEGFHASGPLDLDSLSPDEPVFIELVPLPGEEGQSLTTVETWAEPLMLVGKVLDRSTGAPIPGVDVLLDSVLVATTSETGTFRTEIGRSGLYRVEFIRLGYAETGKTLVLEDLRQGIFLTVSMGVEAIELDPVEVSVVPSRSLIRLRDIQHRIRLGHGHRVFNEDLQRRGFPQFEHVLRAMAGINFLRSRTGVAIPVFRQNCSISKGWCPPTVYLDGMKMRDILELMKLPTYDFALVEAYQGATAVPAEFSGSDARCGVIAVWTERGMGLPLKEILEGGGSER